MSAQTEDYMSPNASPGVVTRKVGVRRVNNRPVYIFVAVMALFLIVIALVAFDRAAKQNRPAEIKTEKAKNTSTFANEIAGDRKDGIIPSAPAPLVVPDLLAASPDKAGAVTIARPDNLDVPPVPPKSSQNQQLQRPQMPRDEEAERIRMLKMQMFEEAVKAKTGISFSVPRTTDTPSTQYSSTTPTKEEQLARLAAVRQQIDASTKDDPTAAYKARLQLIQATGTGGSANSSSGTGAAKLIPAVAGRTEFGQVNNGAGQGDRWRLDAQLEAPRSSYEIRAGFVIPATLISGINSELPGQIMAQVSQDVYDTATRKWKLIPQGARLIGMYSSEIAYGQSRVLIAWQRIVFPDGKAMDIGSMPGADSAGYSGFTDQVNNHYLRLFGSAFLLSGVTAGVSLSQPKSTNGGTTQTTSGALSEALGQQLGQVTAQLLTKNMNVSPTLEIRPGYRFNVMVTKDLTFSKPYQAFDY